MGGFISASTSLILIGVIGIGAVQVSTKALSIGQLSAFIMYVMMVIMPAAQIGGISASMNEALGAYARIRDYLSMPTEDNGTASESEIKEYKPSDRKNLVSFENVGFSYQGKDEKQVLDNITFSIPQSGFTAIVGPSGAGKSTLFSLMERFYDPTYGHIKLSGVDISSIPLKKYRSKLAYTEQTPQIFADSLRNNLLVSNSGLNDKRLMQVINRLGLPHSLGYQPDDYNVLDHMIEGDEQTLSGGEAQRISVARALLSDAEILLFDESTSNLDGHNEDIIKKLMIELSKTNSIVVIAHRLSTIYMADNIIVFDSGKTVAQGTHADLAKNCSLYRDLVNSQSLDNR